MKPKTRTFPTSTWRELVELSVRTNMEKPHRRHPPEMTDELVRQALDDMPTDIRSTDEAKAKRLDDWIYQHVRYTVREARELEHLRSN